MFASCWWLLLLTLISPALVAQSLVSRPLSLQQGLPEHFVSGIVQDRTGFVWVATLDGLARFDGRRFKLFRHQPRDARSLASNVVANLQSVSDSTLLVQLEPNSFQLFNTRTETFSELLSKQRLTNAQVYVSYAQLSRDGQDFWGRNERRLTHYRPQQQQLTIHPLPPIPVPADKYPGNTLYFDQANQTLFAPFPGGCSN